MKNAICGQMFTSWIHRHELLSSAVLLLFDDNKVKMARKPGKIWKENPVGGTGKGKR